MTDALGAPIPSREVVVKGALNLLMFRQHLTGLGVGYEVVPLSGDVPDVNFTAYYRDRTVRITADDEQWADLQQWMAATWGSQ